MTLISPNFYPWKNIFEIKKEIWLHAFLSSTSKNSKHLYTSFQWTVNYQGKGKKIVSVLITLNLNCELCSVFLELHPMFSIHFNLKKNIKPTYQLLLHHFNSPESAKPKLLCPAFPYSNGWIKEETCFKQLTKSAWNTRQQHGWCELKVKSDFT